MRVRPGDLARRLEDGLAPVYLIGGEEPLQVEECLDLVRAAARARSFTERVVLHVEQGFDWATLREYQDSLSLFAERRLIDLRMPAGPGREGAEALRDYVERPSPDNVLLASTARLDGQTTRSAWFKALDAAGVTVATAPVAARELPAWIERRAARLGLRLSSEAVALLAERNEGNLLALAQELEKARLLGRGEDELGVDEVMSAVADSARFGVFDLVDSAFAGDARRTVRILGVLREEGVEPLAVLGPLAWSLRSAARVRRAMDGGAGVDQALREARVFAWNRKKDVVASAMRRHGTPAWHRMLRGAGAVDRTVKSAGRGQVWDELERLCLLVTGTRVLGR